MRAQELAAVTKIDAGLTLPPNQITPIFLI